MYFYRQKQIITLSLTVSLNSLIKLTVVLWFIFWFWWKIKEKWRKLCKRKKFSFVFQSFRNNREWNLSRKNRNCSKNYENSCWLESFRNNWWLSGEYHICKRFGMLPRNMIWKSSSNFKNPRSQNFLGSHLIGNGPENYC